MKYHVNFFYTTVASLKLLKDVVREKQRTHRDAEEGGGGWKEEMKEASMKLSSWHKEGYLWCSKPTDDRLAH